MASTNHTSNYDLPQWEATDPFKREDFNDAFQKIDTEIKGANDAASNAVNAVNTAVSQIECCNVMVGTYTGDSTSSRTISLGVTPKAVVVIDKGLAILHDSKYYGGAAVTGYDSTTVKITTGGFIVRNSGSSFMANSSSNTYLYIALY